MADGISGEVDLFGDPVIVREAKVGRPSHERTPENVKRVSMLFALGRSVAEVALAMNITQPTLRKHYFSEVQQREAMLFKLEAEGLGRLLDQARDGNTAATKALLARCDDVRMSRKAASLPKERRDRAEKDKPIGKKEKAQQDALGVAGKFAPRSGPAEMVN